MFCRIEVAIKPEFLDPQANSLMRRIEQTNPYLKAKLRWARCLDVYWMELSLTREELIYALQEVLWEPVRTWLLSGNLIPSASGPKGTLEDLLETSPHRPGVYYAIEKRLRASVNDLKAHTLKESIETALSKKLDVLQIHSGSILLCEGKELEAQDLNQIASSYFTNPLFESFSISQESELIRSERFFAERIKREMPSHAQIKRSFAHSFMNLGSRSLESDEKRVSNSLQTESLVTGLKKERASQNPLVLSLKTPVSSYTNLWKETLIDSMPMPPWLLAGLESTRGMISLSEEEGVTFGSSIRSQSLSQDPVVISEQAISEATLDSMGGVIPAYPILLSDSICLNDLTFSPLEGDELSHPRRFLSGLRHGLSLGSSQFATPILNGSIGFDSQSNPQLRTKTLLMIQALSCFQSSHLVPPEAGDLLVLIGNPHPKMKPELKLEDDRLFKRMFSFLQEHSVKGVYSLAKNSLIESLRMCSESVGGVHLIKTSQSLDYLEKNSEQMLVIIESSLFTMLEQKAQALKIGFKKIGHLIEQNKCEISLEDRMESFEWSQTNPEFKKIEFHSEVPSKVKFDTKIKELPRFELHGIESLLRVLAHPQVCSREWMIQHFDLDSQGRSLMKPLHLLIGPNDAGVVRSPTGLGYGITQAQGSSFKWQSLDPYRAALYSADEAVRNALSAGSDYGKEDSVFAFGLQLALTKNYESQNQIQKTTQFLEGLKKYSQELFIPFVTAHVDAVLAKEDENYAVVHSFAKLSKPHQTKSSDFKNPGDYLYLIGNQKLGLLGSIVSEFNGVPHLEESFAPDWESMKRIYSWLGGAVGKEQKKIRSLHDVSDGGVLAAISESLIARQLGAKCFYLPSSSEKKSEMLWKFWMGEGLGHFVMSLTEADSPLVEAEMEQLGVPFTIIGVTTHQPLLQVYEGEFQKESVDFRNDQLILNVETKVLKQAYKKEGYWK